MNRGSYPRRLMGESSPRAMYWFHKARSHRRIYDLIWVWVYKYLAHPRIAGASPFMNYGYSWPDFKTAPQLREEDESNRLSAQLYHRTVGSIDMRDLCVLEVSCGHGGGAAYITNNFAPSSYIGLDRTHGSIRYCRKTHCEPSLSFRIGSALNLPYPDQSFDAVLNVEASHCYTNFRKFLQETRRVLKPEGFLLYSDYRFQEQITSWRSEIESTGFLEAEIEDITVGVLQAIDKSADSVRLTIDLHIPRLIRPLAYEFAGLPGTAIYRSFVEGERKYLRFVYRKTKLEF